MPTEGEFAPQSGTDAVDFVLYLFVLGPIVEFLVKSKRINAGDDRRRGIVLAIAVLAVVAVIKTGLEVVGRPPNYFEVLGVPTSATAAEIKRAYRTKSLEMHPDKNIEDPLAQEKFTKMRAAYEVLSESRLRDIYQKFGEWGLEEDKTGANGGLYMGMAVFYVIWVVVAFLLTMGKANGQARVWVYSGLVALAYVEYVARFANEDYMLPTMLPGFTICEKVEVLHALFPPFLHGCKMIGQVIYVDPELHMIAKINLLHDKLNYLHDMVQRLQQLHSDFDAKGERRPPPPQLKDSEGGSASAFPNGGSSAVATAPQASIPSAAAPGAAPVNTPPKGGAQKLTNVIYFFAIYFAFQWIIGRTD